MIIQNEQLLSDLHGSLDMAQGDLNGRNITTEDLLCIRNHLNVALNAISQMISEVIHKELSK